MQLTTYNFSVTISFCFFQRRRLHYPHDSDRAEISTPQTPSPTLVPIWLGFGLTPSPDSRFLIQTPPLSVHSSTSSLPTFDLNFLPSDYDSSIHSTCSNDGPFHHSLQAHRFFNSPLCLEVMPLFSWFTDTSDDSGVSSQPSRHRSPLSTPELYLASTPEERTDIHTAPLSWPEPDTHLSLAQDTSLFQRLHSGDSSLAATSNSSAFVDSRQDHTSSLLISSDPILKQQQIHTAVVTTIYSCLFGESPSLSCSTTDFSLQPDLLSPCSTMSRSSSRSVCSPMTAWTRQLRDHARPKKRCCRSLKF